MKVFLTGITGFLGKHVAQTCLQAGMYVTALCRKNSLYLEGLDSRVRFVTGDLVGDHSWSKELEAHDAVVHCAADTNMSAYAGGSRWLVNTLGLTNIARLSREAGVRMFVHVSTANTMLNGAVRADETTIAKISRNALPYVNTKIEGEEMLLEEFRNSGFPVCIVNPTFVLGPGDHRMGSTRLIRAMLKNRVIAHTSGGKNIVDVRDVADAVVNAISRGQPGHRYLLASHNIGYAELIDLVSRASNRKSYRIRMPGSFWMMVGYSGSLLGRLVPGGTTVNHKTMRLAMSNPAYNSEKAKRELGFTCRPLEETIRDTVQWILNQKPKE